VCGITGFVLQTNQGGAWATDLPAAVAALHHRGPDDDGHWLSADGRAGLGHKRLSILDLSLHGHQPMFHGGGEWAMVYNGEIYNFREIRAELEPLGHRFEGSGDSEVLLAAFAQWGMQAVQRFIGMFAIALWSRSQRRLYLIRDRLGVKPLYYGWANGALFFGSELKALRAFRNWQPAIDRDALADYLRYGYIGDPRSIYQGVHKLPPGHWLELDESGPPRVQQYWSIVDSAQHKHQASEAELTEQLEQLLDSAFNYRMVSDVPVGVFLSGGIDSSLLAAVLQKNSPQRIKTFTIGFNDAERNEAPYAEAVARHLGTEQHTRILEVDEAMRILPQWGDLYDEPFADSSGIPTLLVSRMASEQVKVVLSADGGDELFSGYSVYGNLTRQNARLNGFSPWQRQGMRKVLGLLPWQKMDDYLAQQQWHGLNHRLRHSVSTRFSKIHQRLGVHSIGEMYEQSLAHSYWPEQVLERLIGAAPSLRPNADSFAGVDGEKMCLWDLHNYLPGDVLTKVDRATMAAHIEGREPLLDHRLAEFAFSLPYSLRHGELGPKHLLRKVLYRHVPRALIDRPKQGFGIPLKRWLTGGMRPLVDQYLNDSRLRAQGLFDPDTVRTLVRRLDAGDDLAVKGVWFLVAFQMWHARWMEGYDATAVMAA